MLLLWVLCRELFRFLCRSGKLVCEFCLESVVLNSSPKNPCSFLWNPRLMLDFEPELLTVVALATDGRRSSAW